MSDLLKGLGHIRAWLFRHQLAHGVRVVLVFDDLADFERAKVARLVDEPNGGIPKRPNEFEAHGLKVQFATTYVPPQDWSAS